MNTTKHGTDHDTKHSEGLERLADVPPPRRSDAAFALAVQDGVSRRRNRTLFALPALAAAAAAFAFVVVRADDGRVPEETRIAAASPVLLADPFDDEDALFALPSLDGSSDEELANLDRVLDRRLAARRSP